MRFLLRAAQLLARALREEWVCVAAQGHYNDGAFGSEAGQSRWSAVLAMTLASERDG